MAREFRLPDLGSGLKEGEIVRWLVQPGDAVTTEDMLCEVETEKAVIEVPVPYDGTVVSLAAAEGESVAVGAVLATFDTDGSTSAEHVAGVTTTPDSDDPSAIAGPQATTESASPAPPVPAGGAPDRTLAMPAVRRMARESNLDLSEVKGTGREGRVTKGDVLAWLKEREKVPATVRDETRTASGGEERVRLSRLRKTIAERMARSWQEIPHVFTRVDARADGFLEVRSTLSDLYGLKVPVEALLIRAVLPALREFPEFNATLEGDELVQHKRYDISIAVDTDDGLVLPTVHGADAMSVKALTEHLHDLLPRAMQRKANPDELSGGTFTVNNIGALGLIKGTSIIPHGTTAILSAGRAVETPVVNDSQLVILPMMEITLSFDHRVIDGGMAQRFMNHVKRNIEEAARLLA